MSTVGEAGESGAVELRPGRIVEAPCPCCRGNRLRVRPFRYAFRGRFLYGVTCVSCGLTFLHPMPDDDEIRGLYTEEYFTACSDTCGAHGPRAYMEMLDECAEDRRAGAAELDRRLVRHLGRRGDLCEVGCGPGDLLEEMRRLGWRVTGLELSEFAAEQARSKLGLSVVTGPIAPDAFRLEQFDAVFMGDVLEHLPAPLVSLEAVRSWLRPGGVLGVAVPSTLNLVSARIGMGLYTSAGRFKTLRIPPYHLFEYTPRTLRGVLRAAGFSVLELRQGTVPLRRMGLRGSAVENAGKVALQLLAHATARVLNRGGDRLLAIARRNRA